MDGIEQAWQKLQDDWDDDEAHKRFAGACLSAGQLPEAGRRYKMVKQEGGPRAERADAQIQKLFTLGMTLIKQDRTEAPKKRSPIIWVFAILVFVVLVGASLFFMSNMIKPAP